MARQIPEDHNYRTECPVSVKGKITQLENAAMEYAFIGTKDPLDHDAIVEYAQSSRYDLEQTVMTEIKKAVRGFEDREAELAEVRREIKRLTAELQRAAVPERQQAFNHAAVEVFLHGATVARLNKLEQCWDALNQEVRS